MTKQDTSSITLEDAVARMVNMNYIPTGFTLIEMTAAFQEEAGIEYENAKNGHLPDGLIGPLSADLIERLKIRMEVCEARNSLTQQLIDAIEHEPDDPQGLLVRLSDGSSMDQPFTLISVYEWASDKFGIVIPEWSHPNYLEKSVQKVPWEDVTIKIYANHKIGCFIGTGERKRSSFQEIGLMGSRKNEPNQLGGILIGLSQKKKFPSGSRPEAKDATAISKLRNALEQLTDLTSDPFCPFNKAEGWKPRFKLIDDRRNADERAKERATHVSLDETRDYEDENDPAQGWLDKNG